VACIWILGVFDVRQSIEGIAPRQSARMPARHAGARFFRVMDATAVKQFFSPGRRKADNFIQHGEINQMKHLVMIVLLACSTPLFAQEQTLFDGGLESGGFGGPAVKFTSVQKEFAVMAGGYGGWLINHQFMIGGGGYGLATEHEISNQAMTYYNFPRKMYLEFAYGGGMLEYICTPNKLLHGSVNVLIGAGGVTYRESQYEWENMNSSRRSDAFFVVEPTVSAELNLTTWMRLDVGAGYRFITGIGELVGISNSDFSGPSGSVTVKFGSF
jgi:hypothetical protein